MWIMARLRDLWSRRSQLATTRRGVAIVEFAVVLPVFLLILVPVVDIGMGFYYKVQVSTAAEAGTQYAFVHGWNSAGISTAVTSATGLSSIVVSTGYPRKACGCANGTQIANQSTPPCTGTPCTDVNSNPMAAGTYVFVQAEVVYTPLLAYALMGSSVTLTSQSVVRIQ